MAEVPVTETPVGRSMVVGACGLIIIWSVFICLRIQMATQDRGVGAAYWAKRPPITLEERIREIQQNPRIPPQAKRMAIMHIRNQWVSPPSH